MFPPSLSDPLTEHLKMRSILSYRCWHLFAEDGKPRVLFRMKRTVKDSNGIPHTALHWEWGDLDSSFFTDGVRPRFKDAWFEYTSWTTSNA